MTRFICTVEPNDCTLQTITLALAGQFSDTKANTVALLNTSDAHVRANSRALAASAADRPLFEAKDSALLHIENRATCTRKGNVPQQRRDAARRGFVMDAYRAEASDVVVQTVREGPQSIEHEKSTPLQPQKPHEQLKHKRSGHHEQ